MSCSFGLVQLNISKAEILDTYYFPQNGINSSVYSCYVFDDKISSPSNSFLPGKIFVATSSGVFAANTNSNNLIDPNNWSSDFPAFQNGVSLGNINTVFSDGFIKVVGQPDGEGLFICPKNSCAILVFSEKTDGFSITEIPQICDESGIESKHIISIELKNNRLMGFSDNILFGFLDTKNMAESFLHWWIASWNYENSFTDFSFTTSTIGDLDVYFSDETRGLLKASISAINNQWTSAPLTIKPNGPSGSGFGDMDFVNNKLVISHGGKNGSWNNLGNNQELSIYQNHSFKGTDALIPLEINDAITIIPKPESSSGFFVGTWNYGLLEFDENGTLESIYNDENSSLESITKDGWVRIGGGCFDPENKLWLTSSEANKPISSFDGADWESYNLSSISNNTMSGKILCAKNGQKWVQLRNSGLIVFNEVGGEIIEKKLSTSSVLGGLNSNTINCFAEDNGGSIWVGTGSGINVFYFPENILSSNEISSEQILVEIDDYVEPLLNNTNVLDIKIDGGNRKWLATEGKGVFLMSEDGSDQIHHFTKENSPLLGNTIYGIEIDHLSGKVFFATNLGLCSFRSGSTKDNGFFENVLVFPNPVKRNYNGLITISGLTDNTNIKITDISGNLVFETKSEGGSAIWNGRSFSGKKVKTGVYLFFCTNPEFSESVVKKVLIYN